MNQEDQLRQEASEAASKISNVAYELRAEKERVEARLEELRKELPDALTNAALGLTTKERATAIKKAIAEAEEFLSDFPLIETGLDRRAARANQQLGRASRQAERRERYEQLKEQLTESRDLGLASYLKDYAHELGEDDDCERFLAAFEKEKA